MEFISKPRNIVSKHRKRWPTLLLIKVNALGCGASTLTHCSMRKSIKAHTFWKAINNLSKKSKNAGTNFSQEILSLQIYYLPKYHQIQTCRRHIHRNILYTIIYNEKQCSIVGNGSIYSTDINASTDSLSQSIFFFFHEIFQAWKSMQCLITF